MRNKTRAVRLAVVAGLGTILAGCAVAPNGEPQFLRTAGNQFQSIFNSPDPCSDNSRNIGAAVGAVVGAITGYVIKHNAKSAAIGAVAGAGVGGVIGYVMDQKRCRLYKIAQANHLKFASATITPEKLGASAAGKPDSKDTTIGLDVQLQNQGDEFVPGTAKLTPKAENYFSEIAEQYSPKYSQPASGNSQQKQAERQTTKHKVLIVVHSDEGQNPEQSKALTEARAQAVAEVFNRKGVPANNIYFQGAGSTLPIANNTSSKGRSENQRIEIVDVPGKTDLKQFLRQRQPNAAYFKNVTVSARAASQESLPTYKSHKSVAHESTGFDFGGEPITKAKAKPIVLGTPVERSMFSFISPAYADTQLSVSQCRSDQPRAAGAVRNLATGKELPIRDYMPGFYGASWLGGFNGNLVAVNKAFVPRDSGSPIPEPQLMIYKNYQGDVKAKPSYAASVPVNVYRGSKATLYRIFIDGPVQCIDLIKPASPGNADGRLYYVKDGVDYLADGAFALK